MMCSLTWECVHYCKHKVQCYLEKKSNDKVIFRPQPILCWAVASMIMENLETFSPGGNMFVPTSHRLEGRTEDRAVLERRPESHVSHCWVLGTWPGLSEISF